jgi:hypothetical protein
MKLVVEIKSVIVSSIIGGVIGYIGGPTTVLIIWVIAGLAVGYFCNSRKSVLLNGAVYGFTLAYIFMVSGYNGSASVSTKLLPFLVFGVVGAICGTALALSGRYLAKHLK